MAQRRGNSRFAEVPRAEIQRSSFDRSHGLKTTFNAGYLIPIFVDEALPGDTFAMNMAAFARLATPINPFMDNLYLSSFFFAVPIRLIWDNWEKFNGAQTNPGDSTDYTIPQMVSPGGGYAEESLSDYLGLPTKVAGITHSSLWHRAYYLIWNEWFRDQNLQNSLAVPTGDGPDTPGNFVLQKRGKRHDYFTSALPWPQKGDSVSLPLGTSAPVTGLGKVSQTFPSTGAANAYETGGTGAVSYPDWSYVDSNAGDNAYRIREDATNPGFPDVRADLSAATAATINQLRQAFQLQKLYERDARGGTRYTEIVRAHFGVVSPDARLQRPEYLGGGRTHVNVNPVAQTSSTDVTTPQGNLSAFATAAGRGHGFVKSFTEHCVLIGMVSLHADLSYQQGLNRMFSRSTRFDFFWPALAHIGEQAILNKEIYSDGSGNDDLVFGYQERFAEYRYKPSLITGKMRSNSTVPLDTWHLAQEFGSLPALNASFIEENPPVTRVSAVSTEPHMLLDGYFQLRCARPMPVYGVPGMLDHF